MLETPPFIGLFDLLFNNFPGTSHIAYLTTLGVTAEKNIAEFHRLIRQQNLLSSTFKAQNQEDWRKLYKQLQDDPKIDFIILGSVSALAQWDQAQNQAWIQDNTQKLTAATQDWMMPYASIGYTKLPEEQGLWAAQASIEVLQGTPIHYLPVVPNQQFTLWKNPRLLKKIEKKLPANLLIQAKTYNYPESSDDTKTK